MKLYYIRSDGRDPDNPLDLFVKAINERVALVCWLTYWQQQGKLTADALTPNYDLYLVPVTGVGVIHWGASEQGGVELMSSSYMPELDCAIVGPTKFNRAERALIRSLCAMHAEIREGEDPAKVANNVLRILTGNSRVDLVTGRPETGAEPAGDLTDEARVLGAILALIDAAQGGTLTTAIISDAEDAYSSLEIVLDDGSGTLELTNQPAVVQARIAAQIAELRARADALVASPALTDTDRAALASINEQIRSLYDRQAQINGLNRPPLTQEQADDLSRRAT